MRVLSETEVSDGYAMLMRKAAKTGILQTNAGQFDSYIILPCCPGCTNEEIELAIAICAHWAAGRKVEWCALPPIEKEKEHLLTALGYVGCRLDDETQTTLHTDMVARLMGVAQ